MWPGRNEGNAWARDIRGNLGIDEIGQYIMIWRLIEGTHLTDQPDRLVWKWTPVEFTLITAYRVSLRILYLPRLEAHWEEMGTTPGEILQLAGVARPVDRCWMAERLARQQLQTSPPVFALRPGA
jgi:hypothetical protein